MLNMQGCEHCLFLFAYVDLQNDVIFAFSKWGPNHRFPPAKSMTMILYGKNQHEMNVVTRGNVDSQPFFVFF